MWFRFTNADSEADAASRLFQNFSKTVADGLHGFRGVADAAKIFGVFQSLEARQEAETPVDSKAGLGKHHDCTYKRIVSIICYITSLYHHDVLQ